MKQNNRINILFIARTYPPLVGGMERFAEDFYHHLQDLAKIKLIANTIGKKNIVQFFFKVMWYLVFNANKFDLIHLNDAIMSPLIPIIRLFSSAKVTMTVHGLDIVYNKFGYQYLIIPFLKFADMLFPVSRYTKEQCISRKLPEEKCHVIPNGLNFSEIKPCTPNQRDKIIVELGLETEDKTILLSLGRLIERKGHLWFLENVFSKIPKDYYYLIAGDGPMYQAIADFIKQNNYEDRVTLLGYVTEDEKACLFDLCDLFIMPNITDLNDQEGFGIVLLEAGSYGVPSIASNIEGIRDAVIDGVSGVLVDEKDIPGFIDAITNNPIARKHIAQRLRDKYDWKIIGNIYYNEFLDLLDQD